jgi:hypothetical protein
LAGSLQQYGQSAAGARSGLASGLLGIGAQMGAGASQLGSQLAGYGGQMAGIGQNLEALNRGQRSELAGYGADARNISDMQNQRQYLQQLQQQMRPLQTMQQIGSMLPGYQQAGSTIQSAYGMAPDPNAQGLGAAFAAYGAWYPIKETNMNFLERKMFANGEPSTPSGPLGPNQIYDTVSGKFYNLDEGFVDNLFLKGRNLYPILKDDTLVKGSNVAAALEKFRDQDERLI